MDYCISVIVPIYNAERYIEKCVRSIMVQTYSNIEIILVDDGSTDSSLLICEKLAKEDSRIVIVKKENGGQQEARIAGVRASKGKYIGFTDADDWIDNNMLEVLINQINDADIITSAIRRIDSRGRIEDIWYDNFPPGEYLVDSDYVKDNLIIYSSYDGGRVLGGISNNMVNKIYKRELVESVIKKLNVRVLDEEDFLFNILAVLNSKKMIVTHEMFYNYRVNNSGMSVNINEDFLAERASIYKIVKTEINKKGSKNLLEQLQRKILFELTYVGKKMAFNDEILLPIYSTDEIGMLHGKKLLIYGVGDVGKSYIKILRNNGNVILGYLDDKIDSDVLGLSKIRISNIKNIEYDYIVCASTNKKYLSEMKEVLMLRGVTEERIIDNKAINIYRDYYLGRKDE